MLHSLLMIECCEALEEGWVLWGGSFRMWPGTGSSGAGTTPCGRLLRWGNLGKRLLRNKDFEGISGDSMNFKLRFEDPLKFFCFGQYSIRRET